MHSVVRASCAALALALGLAACSKEPETETVASLFISPTSRRIDDRGQTTDLRVTAQDASGRPGTGNVVLSALAGQFDNGMTEITVALDAQGQAVTGFACNIAVDANCKGSVRIDGKWDAITGATTLLVGSGNTPNPPPTDGGTNNPGDGGTNTPTDGGEQPPPPVSRDGLSLSLNKQQVVSNTGDYAIATARLVDTANAPRPNELIEFSVTAADLTPFAGGLKTKNLSVRTDAEGVAQVRVYGGSLSDIAELKARYGGTGVNVELALPLEVVVVQQISWMSTKCSGSNCTVMGIKGSGFNEQAQVTFIVTDVLGRPVPRLLVTFEIVNPPLGTSVSTEAVSRADGTVIANVASGPVVGAVSVRASVTGTTVTTDSATIGIRGAKPSNQGFILKCNRYNMAAYDSATPPKSLDAVCTVQLVDRFNNAVGTGTSVFFKPEAGSIPNAVATAPYKPTGTNEDEGSASETFSTLGRFPATDVAPLAVNAGQWPIPLVAEPSVQDGFFLRNPRDGLVNIVAYVRGEEYFNDNNANGVWDQGEMFIDQGEVFVDDNDNNTWDPGEFYIDDSPADGRWTAPNGRWDANLTIWTSTHVLYTDFPIAGRPYSELLPSPFSTSCADGIPKGGSRALTVKFTDLNLNRPTDVDFELGALLAGSITFGSIDVPDGIVDSVGFGIQRHLTDATSGQACTAASGPCHWKTVFSSWSEGRMATATVFGDIFDGSSPCEKATAVVRYQTKPGVEPERYLPIFSEGYFQ